MTHVKAPNHHGATFQANANMGVPVNPDGPDPYTIGRSILSRSCTTVSFDLAEALCLQPGQHMFCRKDAERWCVYGMLAALLAAHSALLTP